MKKRYIFILELEAQVGEKISMADEKKNRFFNELLTEVLKNNNILRDFIEKKIKLTKGVKICLTKTFQHKSVMKL